MKPLSFELTNDIAALEALLHLSGRLDDMPAHSTYGGNRYDSRVSPQEL